MKIRSSFAVLSLLLASGTAQAAPGANFPVMEKVAQKVIDHYNTTSCADLAKEKQQPATGKKADIEEAAIRALHNDAQMRTEFLNRVAPAIANKLFQCGMIP